MCRKYLEIGKKRRLEEMDAADAQVMAAEAEMTRLSERVEALRMKVVVAEQQRNEIAQLQEQAALLDEEGVALEDQRRRDEYRLDEALVTGRRLGEHLVQAQQQVLELRYLPSKMPTDVASCSVFLCFFL